MMMPPVSDIFFALFMLDILACWWVNAKKIIPVLRQSRGLKWSDLLAGPHQFFVFTEYRDICIRDGLPMTWVNVMAWLYIGLPVFLVLFWCTMV